MLLAGRCFAPLSKWQQKEYWLKFLIWGKNVGNKQVSFLFQSEASELNIYIKWKSMQKNLSEEQRQRDQCPAIEWVLDNQEVKSEEKILSLLPRSAKWNENAIHSLWEVQVKINDLRSRNERTDGRTDRLETLANVRRNQLDRDVDAMKSCQNQIWLKPSAAGALFAAMRSLIGAS